MSDDEVSGDLSPWHPRQSELQSLSEVLAEVMRDEEDERHQIAVRFTPPAFRAIMAEIARENAVSYSVLARKALDVGMDWLDHHAAIVALREAFYVTRADAMSSGDSDGLDRLTQTMAFDFQRSQLDRTTLAVSRNTSARLAELALVCGIVTGKLAVEAVLIALLTLPNNRGYRRGLIDEVVSFHRFVLRRRRVLLMSDEGPGPDSPRRRLR